MIYASGLDAGAWRSADAGATWQRIRGYTFKWGHRVVVDPVNPKMIYITTYGGSVWHDRQNPAHAWRRTFRTRFRSPGRSTPL